MDERAQQEFALSQQDIELAPRVQQLSHQALVLKLHEAMVEFSGKDVDWDSWATAYSGALDPTLPEEMQRSEIGTYTVEGSDPAQVKRSNTL
eukprot:4335386-Amphidinium_carterae.1